MNEKTMARPTAGELEILNVIWTHGPSTVRFVNDCLNGQLHGEKEVGYTTTLKIMQLMAEKGLLERNESQRSHLYGAVAPKEQVQKQMLDRLLDQAFGGSAPKLVMQALGGHKANPEEIARIRELLDRMDGGRQ